MMALADQRQQEGRYTIIPRSLIFLLDEEGVLLIRYNESKGRWAGLYNGLGGHIERGESPKSAARREVLEECGLEVDLSLCGVVIVESGAERGIGIFVFVGETARQSLVSSSEGDLKWAPYERLADIPLLPDTEALLSHARDSYHHGRPFTALSLIQEDGMPRLMFD